MCRWSTAAIFACAPSVSRRYAAKFQDLAAIRPHRVRGGVALVLEHGEKLLGERFEFTCAGLHSAPP
jgi:hypothetical protein